MKHYTNCNDCYLCGCYGVCSAGLGDDVFYIAPKDELIERYNSDEFINDKRKRQSIAKALKERYGVDVVEGGV